MSSWESLLVPSPTSVYWSIGVDFVTSFSFPLFVVYVGALSQVKWWKKNTKPVEGQAIKAILVLYNFVVTVVNVYCFYGFFVSILSSGSLYSRVKDPYLEWIYHVYWCTKVIELSDTAFMLLRHKFRQISTLHVYHHASMLLLSDLGSTRYPYGSFALGLMLNAMVHIFLYTYYGMTAAGYSPKWKKRLTELQIVQFFIDLIHGLIGFLHYNFCFWGLVYGSSMLYLFTDFYLRNYVWKKKEKKAE